MRFGRIRPADILGTAGLGRRVLERVGSALTEERMRSIGERERGIYGTPPGPGEVAER